MVGRPPIDQESVTDHARATRGRGLARACSTPTCKRSPIEQAGPAHIATLKTFDPPLVGARGRGLRGRAPPREAAPLPDRRRRARADGAPDERRPAPVPRAGREGPEDADVPAALRRRRRARPDRGRREEARRASGCCGPTRSRRSSPTSAPRPTSSTRRVARAASSPRDSRRLHSLLRDQRLIAGIGRAWANEILHVGAALAVRALDPARRRGDRAARDGDPRRARARPRAAAAGRRRTPPTYRVHDRLGEPCRRCRHAARAGRLRGAHDLLLPDLPDRGPRAQGPADVEAAAMRIEQVTRGDRGAASRRSSGCCRSSPRRARRRRSSSSPRPSRAQTMLVARDDEDGAIIGTRRSSSYRVSSGLEGPDRGRDRRRLGARPGRRRGARRARRCAARTRPAC